MAYANFIPTVWSEKINRELERLCVFVEDCNREYEGVVKEKGESVKILGVGKPTIRRIARSERNNKIAEAETIEDTSTIMYINQIAYFNYEVGDIDNAQKTGELEASLKGETSEGLANEVDAYIASFANDSSVKKMYGKNPPKVVAHETDAEGEVYVLDVLDDAIQDLQENDVSDSTKVVVTVSPRFYKLYKKAYIKVDTNNHDEIKNGKVGMYDKVVVKRSNNVHKTEGGAVDNIPIRTQRAIAYANPLTHTEAYRPQDKFSDAVKGFILFDAKVVRPKEIRCINVKYK